MLQSQEATLFYEFKYEKNEVQHKCIDDDEPVKRQKL